MSKRITEIKNIAGPFPDVRMPGDGNRKAPHPKRWWKAAVLTAALLLLFTACSSQPSAGADGAEQETDAAVWDEAVAVFGDHALNNRDLGYYYWTGYSSFLDYYGQGIEGILDLYMPLDQQYYDENTTWHAHFLQNALTSFQQYCIICDLAQEAHYSLPSEALSQLNGLEQELQSTAEQTGFETAEQYLKANFGSGASMETYRNFMRSYLTVMEYTYELEKQFTYTEEEIEAYYDDHADTYQENGVAKDPALMADVCYLTVTPAEENTAEAAAVFDGMLAQWEQAPDHSEATLQQLASDWADEGAVLRYLREVYPGGIAVAGFDDWVFRQTRKAGDYTTLEIDGETVLLYYVQTLDTPFWYAQTSYDMLYNDYASFVNEKIAEYPYETHLDRVFVE